MDHSGSLPGGMQINLWVNLQYHCHYQTRTKRILQGKRALIYLENQKDEALDSTMVMTCLFNSCIDG
jgi:hypothetical protein